MFVILGAAGKVGYSTASALSEAGLPVRAVLRDAAKASRLSALGCKVAIADLRDPAALAAAIAGAEAVQIILPPPLYAEDAPGEMRQAIDSMVAALRQARPTRVLAISDYGAHVPDDIGMPTMYRVFEERLRSLDTPKVLLRSAEHMEGWARSIPVAMATGILPTLHDEVDRTFATVSTVDVGRMAADLLRHPGADMAERIVHIEGPRRYSAADVAGALSLLLGRTIIARAVPRREWQQSLERVLSASLARLLVALYDAHGRGGLIDIEPGRGEVRHGTTDLIEALRPFVPAR
ncbi:MULTISPECIES: NAD(P)H-binding protein [unclassified Ensifer]|uniref:NAD(P)H-binding protein n=1 Tax=unclassified Ensifer TaxID=2633371 RepID=UPI00081384F9|nr:MULTISPECIES: NAD(P)H-binding protein [unclassified Ensifer]OCP00730.1 NmrA family transcriptional regulator [Ensifer sp. LC14]OCP04589.1 NmrA family transcriptional regulator [Ensifer sp. LC11]OCP09641.1 NmrA family transcriptional regulator [Ensifer sp. LC13]OCP30687.1 NmrA family transcriptional regulator [Ensifer sp. LC499]